MKGQNGGQPSKSDFFWLDSKRHKMEDEGQNGGQMGKMEDILLNGGRL